MVIQKVSNSPCLPESWDIIFRRCVKMSSFVSFLAQTLYSVTDSCFMSKFCNRVVLVLLPRTSERGLGLLLHILILYSIVQLIIVWIICSWWTQYTGSCFPVPWRPSNVSTLTNIHPIQYPRVHYIHCDNSTPDKTSRDFTSTQPWGWT
jgi:hypothetical protein